MRYSTAFFLILLRLAIGWHFLVEGWLKVESTFIIGETENRKPFSSAGYFREAQGPLGSWIRQYAGDPDREALSRLVVLPVPEGKDPNTYDPKMRIPPGLRKAWEKYLDDFHKRYALRPDTQLREAQARLEQAESKVVTWLTYEAPKDPAAREKDANYLAFTTEQTRTAPGLPEVKKRMTMAERIAEYREKLGELQEADTRRWSFGKDVEAGKVRALKTEVAKLRNSLLSDLDKQTEAYKEDLAKILTKDQKEMGPLEEPVKPVNLIEEVDQYVPWALLGIGGCLLVGFFTRTAAFLAAVFLLMTYLAVPSFPWLAAPPASEGNYLFVNKNVIEMLALFVLATSDAGKWIGIDGIFAAIGNAIFGKKKDEVV